MSEAEKPQFTFRLKSGESRTGSVRSSTDPKDQYRVPSLMNLLGILENHSKREPAPRFLVVEVDEEQYELVAIDSIERVEVYVNAQPGFIGFIGGV